MHSRNYTTDRIFEIGKDTIKDLKLPFVEKGRRHDRVPDPVQAKRTVSGPGPEDPRPLPRRVSAGVNRKTESVHGPSDGFKISRTIRTESPCPISV
jgi:hypothetical protein